MKNKNTPRAAAPAQHTPGPWSMHWKVNGYSIQPGIGEVFGGGMTPEANARLIAAAPQLLAACELALLRADCDLRMWPLKDEGSVEHTSLVTYANKLRAAIAAATKGTS